MFLVALIYGSTYVVAKGVMPEYLGPGAFIFIRITIAGLLFNLVAAWKGFEKVSDRKDLRDLAIAAFFGVTFNMLFFFKGLVYTTELNASVLMLISPVFVLIFAWILLKEKIHSWQIVGMLVAAMGAILLIGGTNFQFSGDTVVGDGMILINATSFAFFLVYVKRLLTRYHALTVIRLIFIFGWIYVLPFSFEELNAADFRSFPAVVWWSIGYVTLATTFVAYLLNAWAVKHASPTIAGSYIYLQPVIATGIGIMIGKQLLSAEKIIFAMLIFIGVYLVTTYKKQA